MTKKQLILFAGILLVLVYSCRKNFMPEMEVNTAANGKFSVTAARDHIKALVRGDVAYDGKLPAKIMSVKGTTTQSATQPKTIKTGQQIFYPFWDKAITATYKGKVEYIEVPIAISKRQIRLYQFKQDNIKQKPDASVAKAAFQTLVVYKTTKGGVGQRLLTYIPDKQYLIEHGYEASTNSLSKLNRDFFGYIEYKNWSGDIVAVLRIENGKVVRRYTINKASKEKLQSLKLQPTTSATGKIMSGSNTTGSTLQEVCEWVWIPIMETVCKVNEDGNANDENLNEIECTLEEVGEYTDLVCTWIEVPDPEPCPWGDCDEECPWGDCEEPEPDCDGVVGSGAYIADCGCIGGTTGLSACPEDPCDEVRNQSADNSYKAKATELKGKTNLKYESGYEQKKDGSYNPLTNSGNDALNASPNSTTKGYIHNHVDDYESGEVNSNGDPMINKPIKMFSPADVNTLMNLVNQNSNSSDLSDYYVSLVSDYGHYMIKFTGTTGDINTNLGGDEWSNKYRDFMAPLNNLEKGFLQFLKNEMGVNGVELFKIKNNGTVKSIKLKPNGKSTEEKDC